MAETNNIMQDLYNWFEGVQNIASDTISKYVEPQVSLFLLLKVYGAIVAVLFIFLVYLSVAFTLIDKSDKIPKNTERVFWLISVSLYGLVLALILVFVNPFGFTFNSN